MSELENHCKDCCCAKSWDALGITKYTGKSIPEHISEMAKSHQSLVDALELALEAMKRVDRSGDEIAYVVMDAIPAAEAALSKARQGETV